MVQHLTVNVEQIIMTAVAERQKAVAITALLAPKKVAPGNLLFALMPRLQEEERVA
jgi:hypothetical protein